MMIYVALYPRDDVDRLWVSKKEGVKWLTSIEYSVDASIQRLEDHIKISKKRKTNYSEQNQHRQHNDQ